MRMRGVSLSAIEGSGVTNLSQTPKVSLADFERALNEVDDQIESAATGAANLDASTQLQELKKENERLRAVLQQIVEEDGRDMSNALVGLGCAEVALSLEEVKNNPTLQKYLERVRDSAANATERLRILIKRAQQAAGLLSARDIVEAMKMLRQPNVESTKPCQEADTTQMVPIASPKVVTRPLSILVVDDEATNRELLLANLEILGHTVVTASNGQEALKIFGEGGDFDLVITDRQMPEMDGDQLASWIMSISPSTPVIMLTAQGQTMIKNGEKPRGVTLVLPKPYSQQGLQDAIEEVMPKEES